MFTDKEQEALIPTLQEQNLCCKAFDDKELKQVLYCSFNPQNVCVGNIIC